MRDSRIPVMFASLVLGVLLAGALYGFLRSFEQADSEFEVIDLGALQEGAQTRVFGFNSLDGLTGEIQTREGKLRAFVWSPEEGLTVLETLGGNASYGRALNDAGQAVGFSDIEGTGTRAFLWTRETGMTSLDSLVGDDGESAAYGCSADGSTIVGSSSTESGSVAIIWDVTHGTRSIQALLKRDTRLAPALHDWKLRSATAISADGSTVVGYGTNPSGRQEGWVAAIAVSP